MNIPSNQIRGGMRLLCQKQFDDGWHVIWAGLINLKIHPLRHVFWATHELLKDEINETTKIS